MMGGWGCCLYFWLWSCEQWAMDGERVVVVVAAAAGGGGGGTVAVVVVLVYVCSKNHTHYQNLNF